MSVQGGWTCSPSLLTHPSVLVHTFAVRKQKTRRHVRINGLSPDVVLHIPDNNFVNGYRALLERVIYVKDGEGFVEPTNPDRSDFNGFLHKFKKQLRKHNVTILPYTREQFLGRYVAGRRVLYSKAADSLNVDPIRPDDAKVKMFVKAENTKDGKVPRAISPRGPRYCYSLGVYMVPIEGVLYDAISEVFGEKTVFKGLNAAAQGRLVEEKWLKYRDPVAVSIDATRWDQHVSRTALEWEHSVYRLYFNNREFNQLLRWQLQNNITGVFPEGSVKFRTNGKRMSGDMNTGLGNCLLSCALIWSWLQYKGITASVMNNGDDTVVIMERRDLNLFMDGYYDKMKHMGFRMAIEPPVDFIEGIEFCQTRPIWTPEGYVMVRDHVMARAKDVSTFNLHNGTQKEIETWLASVGACGLSLTGGIPVMQDFYSCIIRGSAGRVPSLAYEDKHQGKFILAKGMERKYSPVHWRTRYSYWLAFGITPDHQCWLEEYYSSYSISHLTWKGVFRRVGCWDGSWG